MNLDLITPLILTYNEAPNIDRTLRPLSWAKEVIVIDSGSTDETLAICKKFQNVRIVIRPFDNHTAQWNFGLQQVKTK
jgi:glycosyltransferase involved in cell wall biosynthesis